MRFNTLINEIVRGMWLMDQTQLDGYAPFVHSLLTGGNLTLPQAKETKLEMKMMDGDGNMLSEAGEDTPDKIAFISMIGPVMKYGDMCTYGADEIVNMLDRANSNKSVKGIVFYVDGPGGAVSAINPFIDFSSRKRKPIVALVDQACSLHYWAICAIADHIMGENTISGRLGSVGVESRFTDAQKHWEEKGFVFHTIRPPESDDKNKVFELALAGKYDQIKAEHLSPIAQKFQAGVKQARPQLNLKKPGIITGATFGTEEAFEDGMIDSIGNMHKAVEMVNVLAETYSI